jgi:pimeloyl-ACP methyl ester carboxylesterase
MLRRLFALAFLVLPWSFAAFAAFAETTAHWPIEGFADVNGVRLQYLDWGGDGPALVLIPGLADNPHVFDDFAPAFADRFHVLSYARRSSGNSQIKGPYDIDTLTEDLRGLLNALKIPRTILIGYSTGGEEVTHFATDYPDRVDRIVYLDAGYDFTDPDFRAAVNALPVHPFERPETAMSSLEAYRDYAHATSYPELSRVDMKRIEANLRAKVVLQPDGTLRDRTPKSVIDSLYAALWTDKHRQYAQLHCAALAIYASTLYDLHVVDPQQRDQMATFEEAYWRPYQKKSMDRIRRDCTRVTIANVDGAHGNFLLTHREQVVGVIRRFLD